MYPLACFHISMVKHVSLRVHLGPPVSVLPWVLGENTESENEPRSIKSETLGESPELLHFPQAAWWHLCSLKFQQYSCLWIIKTMNVIYQQSFSTEK